MCERDRVWPSTFLVPWRQSGCCFLAMVLLLADFTLSPALTGLCSRDAFAADAKPPVDARLLWRTGQYAECVDATAATLAKVETDEAARLLKLQAEMELGRYADALATLDAGLKKLPSSVLLRWFGRDVCRYNQQAERADTLETQMVELLRQAPWRYSDGPHQLVIGRWMLSRNVDPKQVLKGVYNEIKKRRPDFVDVHLAIGELALAKHDYQLAGEEYQQAVKLDAENADAHFGVAQAFASSNAKKAEAELAAALKINPQHIPSLMLIVDNQVDAERYDDADRTLTQIAAINPRNPLALAYRAVLAHLRNQPADEQLHRAAALQPWPENPDVDHLIGRKLSQKYRFAEGAQYQRQALEFDPENLGAKGQLSQDLLRLGQEEEGLELAEEVYAADAYNVFAHNLVTLQETLAKFRTLEADGLLVRMDNREAEIYGQRVLALLIRARRELCAKYGVELKQPIVVELFPKQEDFAIRTFGLPGGAGFLGVCFGTVITANSPGSPGAHQSCWEATLWHEFCHVVTLNKTGNKMPRWLSEGISVYEERQAVPSWGQAMTPTYREMILGDDLTPVSQLSGAFLSPKSGLHLQFAYYESSLVVEYLIQKYGQDALQRVLTDLGAGVAINDALTRSAGSIDILDAEFAEFARERANALAPQADWSKPELPKQAKAELIATWLEAHPRNYAGLRRLAGAYVGEKKWPEARAVLEQLRDLYPENGGGDGPYPLLAKVYRELGEPALERDALLKLVELSATELAAFDRLGELATADKDWPLAHRAAVLALAVNPLLPAVQRRAAHASEQLPDYDLAVDSFRALLLLEPFDPAELHYRLAGVLRQLGRLTEAKREALLALEETPRYRAAQRLLLELVAELKANPPADAKADTKESEPADDEVADKPAADAPGTAKVATDKPAPAKTPAKEAP